MPNSLSLQQIVNVSVILSPLAVPAPLFNQALIIGPSTHIPVAERLRSYSNTDDMLVDGFLDTDPEFRGAILYFGQTPQPQTLWVGRLIPTSLSAPTVAAAGTGYTQGDLVIVTPTAPTGQSATLEITEVGSTTGAVTTFRIVSGGAGFDTLTVTLPASGGTGTGFTVNVGAAVGDTPVQAIQGCRNANPSWYACMFVGTATDADHEAIAAYIESATPVAIYFITTAEANILNNVTPNLGSVLKAAKYRRTFTLYSTTGPADPVTTKHPYPDNAYASAAAMGVAMGMNTGAPGSYFTLMFKSLVGVHYEPLTQSQVNVISGTPDRSQMGFNVNVYVNYANESYIIMQNGTASGGTFLDETIFLDMLVAQVQYNAMNLLVSVPAVPLTNAGVAQMTGVISQACTTLQQIGFIAQSGIWNGQTIGPISDGTPLPNGFTVFVPSVTTLSQGDRDARRMPKFNVLLIEGQAAHSLTVSIDVQR